jgi:thioredoxin 1
LQINSKNFDKEIIESKKIALITFTADWCKPSQLQKTLIEKIRIDYFENAITVVIDVDQDEELADRFEARNLPTSVFFANGEIIESLPGFQPDDFLRAYLDHLIEQTKAATDLPDENAQ